jgi:ubiquitin C-terminal hydrolase
MTKGLSGICNLGNTCYMNSALQVILGIDDLNHYLKQIKHGRDNENTIILKEWINLYDLMSSDNVIVKPDRFLKYLQRVSKIKNNELFSGFDQNDASEFFHFFIDCLHESIKNLDNEIKYDNVYKSKKFSKYINDIEKDNMSIIQKLFSGYIEVSYNYKKLRVSQQFEHFYMLSVPINDKNTVNIYDCLDQYFSDEELCGDNAYFYEKENRKVDVSKKTKIIYTPDVLTIHLKRWNLLNLRKNKKKIVFNENLNVSKYCVDDIKGSTSYKLFGVVNHTGNIFGGHYYSHVKKSDGQWYLFNDQQIKRVSPIEIVSDKSYCLFYRKIK